MSEAEKLAEDHWKFVKDLLDAFNVGHDATHKFLFTNAFGHGYKHGKESR